jgi:hypothetical protein
MGSPHRTCSASAVFLVENWISQGISVGCDGT